MDHIAIMNKSWDLIPKIVAGQKTIESRWYKTRRAPWNSIKKGDVVYFKNSSEKITASADVSKVLQFSFTDIKEAQDVVTEYGKRICIRNSEVATWDTLPRYSILIFLKNAHFLEKPFQIDKTGFGTGTAWMCVEDIEKIKI